MLNGVGSLRFFHVEEDFQMSDTITNITDFPMSDNDVRFKSLKFFPGQFGKRCCYEQ
nr:RdRp [Pineapple mealybug wilt-associated virus 3]